MSDKTKPPPSPRASPMSLRAAGRLLKQAFLGNVEPDMVNCPPNTSHSPIMRKNSQHNIAYGKFDTIPINDVSSGPITVRTRKLVTWNARDQMPQNISFQLFSDAPALAGEGPMSIVANLDWTVQTANMRAVIDFAHGTKFQLIADSFTIEAFVEVGVPVVGGSVNVGCIFSQDALANVNGLAPQRTIVAATPLAIPQNFAIPRFARRLSVIRFPITADYDVRYLDNDLVTPIGEFSVAAGEQLEHAVIPNHAARVRIIAGGAGDPLDRLSLVFDVDL